MEIKEHRLTIDDIPLHYSEVGSGDHVVMLLCGLLGCTETDFGPILKRMNHSAYRIICCDPPGCGKSRPHDRDWCEMGVRKDAEIFLKLLDKLSIQKVSLMGWSLGGTTAQVMAIMAPDRVTKIVFWGSYAIADNHCIMFVRLIKNLDHWMREQKMALLKIYGETYLRQMLREWSQNAEIIYSKIQGQALVPFKRIECPTLILHGGQDSIVRMEHPERWNFELKDSRLCVIPNAAHDLHLSHTEIFLEKIESFL